MVRVVAQNPIVINDTSPETLPRRALAGDSIAGLPVTPSNARAVAMPFIANLEKIWTPAQFKISGALDDTDSLDAWAKAVRLDRIAGRMDGEYTISDTLYLTGSIPTISGYNAEDETPLTEYVEYRATGTTRIKLAQINARGVVLRGRGLVIPNLNVEYITGQGMDCPNSWALAFQNLTFSKLGRIKASFGAKYGVDQDWQDGTGHANEFFSNVFDFLWISHYAHFGLNWAAEQTGYATPNVAGHVYIDGRYFTGSDGDYNTIKQGTNDTQVRKNAEFALRISRGHGQVFGAVNIERASTDTKLISLEDAQGVVFGALHMEAAAIGANYADLIRLQGSSLRVGGVSLVDVDMGSTIKNSSGVAINPVGGRVVNLTKYDYGHPTGKFSAEALRWGGNFWPGTSAIFAETQFQQSLEIGDWEDNGVAVDGSNKFTYPASAALLNRYGLPLVTRTPWTAGPMDTASGPSLFVGIAKFNGKAVKATAKACGTGGTRTTTGLVALGEPSGSPAAWYDPFNLHSGGTFTAPENGRYQVTYVANCQYNGSMAVKVHAVQSSVDSVVDDYTSTKASGVYTVGNGYPRSVVVDLLRGDTVYMTLESGGLTFDASTYLIFEAN